MSTAKHSTTYKPEQDLNHKVISADHRYGLQVESRKMTNELFNRRVLREITKAGEAVTCASLSIGLSESPKDIREALHCLIDDGFVIEVGGLYERAHGGYSPDGGSAA